MIDYKNELPWYLRRTQFLIISFLFVPIALIILIVKAQKVEREVLSQRAFIAFLFSIPFALNFLPKNNFYLAILVIFYLFIGLVAILKVYAIDKKD